VLVKKPFKPDLLCPLCGERPAENDGRRYINVEHIPPRGTFVERKDNHGLITVPSCDVCNAGTSTSDQEFQVYLSIHLGTDNDHTKSLWKNALKTTRKNKKLKRTINSNISSLLWRTSRGYLHPVYIPSDVVERAMSKIIRGMHWYVTGEVLPKSKKVDGYYIQQGQNIPKELASLLREFGQSIARCNNQFQVVYAIVEDQPHSSLWLVCFYGQEFFWATIEDADGESGKPNAAVSV
jgi:hypothetical protein